MILHHYDFSNFSEKVRLIFGFKNLAWSSVTIPAHAPKPGYTPLTGGYRRTPALQIGADVYCDTRLITSVLETAVPQPSLYPGAHRDRTRARADALVSWAETSVMRPLALYITGLHADKFSDEFHADRARLHGKAQPTLAQVQASAARYRAQVAAYLDMLENLLAPDQEYVLDEGLSVADLALYEAPWFLRMIAGPEVLGNDYPRMQAWAARVTAVGHGQRSELDAAEALQRARAATPLTISANDYLAPEGCQVGEPVTVSPFDQYSPAQGVLRYVDEQRITLACEHPATGTVHVHFPRLGYRLGRPRT